MLYGRLVGHLLRWALIPTVFAGSRDAGEELLVPAYVLKYGMYFLFSNSSVQDWSRVSLWQDSKIDCEDV